MDFVDRSDNPFAVPLRRANTSRRKSLISAAKIFVFAAAALSLAVVVSNQSQRWLVYQLTRDFDNLPPKQRSERLIQIADLEAAGVDPLVQAMADPSIEVARTGYEMLRQSQNEWTVLESEQRILRYGMLVDSLRTVAMDLPDDRTGWGTSLLQQTMVSAIDHEEEAWRVLYKKAAETLELYALSSRPGPSVLVDEFNQESTGRLKIVTRPLPVSSLDAGERWTDWPPTNTSSPISSVERVASDSPDSILADGVEANSGSPTLNVSRGPASVYRSTATRLRKISSDETVTLREFGTMEADLGRDEDQEPSHDATQDAQPDLIRSATHLGDSPMATFDDVSVMRWLGSPHQVLRDKAKGELISRGYNETSITIATRIHSGDVATRLAMIDALKNASDVDPRPWLLMLLQDDSRDVKLRTVAILGTMNDPEVSRRLRMRLVDEADPTVAARIRRVLQLR